MDESPTCEVKLPGFRFHPTEEELLSFYLKTMAFGKKLRADIIGFLNIYNHDPRELPGLAKKTIVETEREWYFFVPRDRKHGSGGRPNRTTEKGFWKATGSDRKIWSVSDPKKILGLKKTLVFYEGRAPRGRRTDWIMNEYRLPDSCSPPKELVLCKIYRKATSLKVLEQRAAMETSLIKTPIVLSPPMEDSISFEEANVTTSCTTTESNAMAVFKKENQEMSLVEEDRIKYAEQSSTSTTTAAANSTSSSSLVLPNGMMGNLGELQVPQLNMDWTQDAFWTQFRSPWLDNFASFLPMC